MQLLAIGGNAGKQPNSLKPFDKLKKKELLEELKKEVLWTFMTLQNLS